MFKCRKEWETPYGQADRRGFRGDGNFSTRPHAGDDVPDRVRVVGQVIFQPTSPRGGRPGQRRRERPGKAISTHVPTRGTTRFGRRSELRQQFQPTSPRGGRRQLLRQGQQRFEHFNPRPHAGDDPMPLPWPETMLISTHVPTRGTTELHVTLSDSAVISTHVPMRGTTSPRKKGGQHNGISTHVPMRGTTAYRFSTYFSYAISTHVPMRGTTYWMTAGLCSTRFQPTSPCGGRRQAGAGHGKRGCISTHVPTRGTTFFRPALPARPEFQPTSPRGGRRREAA